MTNVFQHGSAFKTAIKLGDKTIRLDIKRVVAPVTNKNAAFMTVTDVTAETSAEILLQKWKSDLECQNSQLVKDKDALTEALAGKSIPDVLIDAQSPFEQTVHLLNQLLKGIVPSPQRLSELRRVLLLTDDLRQPIHFTQQLAHSQYFDHESKLSILQMVGVKQSVDIDAISRCANEIQTKQCNILNEAIETWSFDAFDFCNRLHDPLSSLVHHTLHKSSLVQRLSLPIAAVWQFLLVIEKGY